MVLALIVFSFSSLAYQNVKHIPDVVIGTDGGYPPFTFINDKGELDGFEIKLLKRACRMKRLRCKFVYKDLSFGDLLPGVKNHRFDIAVGGIGYTESRIPDFDFVKTFSATKFFFGPSNTKITTIPDDLAGMKIGVEASTQFVAYIEALSADLVAQGKAPIQITEYPNLEAIEVGLLSGEVTTTPTGIEVIEVLKEKSEFKGFEAIGPEIIGGYKGSLFGQGDGFMLRKGDSLQYYFGEAMQRMLNTCEYARIEKQFFSGTNAYTPIHCRD
ncbi:MAG: amino acid ABC transporter substrate-binding protein [Bdellovibrionales bacterium]|nr:amino acid ABC transporter substrate-binding protein [Bdellovibrionales bacterium]